MPNIGIDVLIGNDKSVVLAEMNVELRFED